MMKRLVWLVLIVAIGSSQCFAQEALSVGSCPHVIEIQRDGLWKSAIESKESLENFRANSARKAIVAVVFVRPEDGSYFNIQSLGTLEAFQGRLSLGDFARIKAALSKPLPSTSERVRDRVQALANGSITGNKLESYDLASRFEGRGNEFMLYGTTTISVQGRSQTYVTAQKNIHVDGCVITMNFGFPAEAYNLDEVSSALRQVWFRRPAEKTGKDGRGSSKGSDR